MRSRWPFVGRDGDLARAESALRSRSAVVLVGSAGVGKSRLAVELLDRLGRRRVLGVVRATASAREIPLGALLDVLPDVSHFHLAVEALGPRDGRDVLLVDDAHLLDELSAAALHRTVARGVRLVLTVRAGEPAPEAVTALWKDDVATRLDIEPLDRERTAAVLAGAVGGPVEPISARRLHETSGGNLLWLRHLVDGELAAGRLRATAGTWVWSGEVTLSPLLGDLVAARLAGLDGAQHRVLELLAILEPLDLDLLEELAGAEAVEEVAQRSLVSLESAGDGWAARLAHPLHGEAVRATTSVPRARRLRAELADALATSGTARAGTDLRRAVLALGDGRRPDPHLMLTAARQASALSDYALAERLLRAAIGAGAGFEASAGLAALLVYLLRVQEADVVLAEAAEFATGPEETVRAVLVRTMVAHFAAPDAAPDDGEAVLREAERRRVGPDEHARFEGMRCILEMCSGRVAEALARGERVLADPASNDDDVALAAWGVGYARAFSGTGGPVGAVVRRGIDAAVRSPVMVNNVANIGFGEIVDAHLRGDPAAAAGRLAWAREQPGDQGAVWVALFEGRMASITGAPRTAIPALRGALTPFPGHGGGWASWLLAIIAQCHGMLGEADEARAALAAAEDRVHPAVTLMRFEQDLAAAWVAAASGAPRDAVTASRRGAERCRTIGLPAAEVLLRQAAVRFGDLEQADRLAELDTVLGTPRSALAAEQAAALAAADADHLVRVAAGLDRAGLRPEAADAAAQAARTARAGRRLVLAAEAEQRARALAAACEDLRTPALAEAEAPVVLSVREREIAHLAGDGLTNRQIAERLGVSVRTVESHVYRACSRLGLPDRAALVAVAGPRPVP